MVSHHEEIVIYKDTLNSDNPGYLSILRDVVSAFVNEKTYTRKQSSYFLGQAIIIITQVGILVISSMQL